MLGFLKAAVAARLNIIISGGTGAGKTTLLNVLSGYISAKERIVTIEDSAELQLKQRHVVRLECRPPESRRQRSRAGPSAGHQQPAHAPNRIIVGEVRGEEALDMLQAMNTGHDGSMTTIHANSPRDALARMETMAMMANLNLPEKAIRKQISSAISLIVQVARFTDGTRRITHITEITGMESDVVSLQDHLRLRTAGSFCPRATPSDLRLLRHPTEIRRTVSKPPASNYPPRCSIQREGAGIATSYTGT